MSKIVNDNGSFRITEGKGFQITFANGYTASVQFGSGNYCSNFADIMETRDNCESSTAEFLAWGINGNDVDVTKGWLNPLQILTLLNETAALPSCL